jgi:glutamyl-Q tRNA(Asp) synthetase
MSALLDMAQTRLGDRLPITRFAPSPTGYLHFGHVVNALYVWGIAHRLGGKVVLRMEDHDRTRCRPAYEAAILEDLEWLGLQPDMGLPSEFRAGASAYRQSDCDARYMAALARLQARGLVYACDCSRKRILARTQQVDVEELRYDGHCRDRNLEITPAATLRLRLPDGPVAFDDLALGMQLQHPAIDVGDIAIRDNHGHWTYQFAVVNDDIVHDINLIIRGMDILSSTGRQIQLRAMLEVNEQPIYLHHPLLTDAHGRKLSKRDFDADIHSLKLAGLAAEHVIGKAAHLAGWTKTDQPMALKDAFRLV